jgi:hypothetical protein
MTNEPYRRNREDVKESGASPQRRLEGGPLDVFRRPVQWVTHEQWDAEALGETTTGLRRFTHSGLTAVAEQLLHLLPEGVEVTPEVLARVLSAWANASR